MIRNHPLRTMNQIPNLNITMCCRAATDRLNDTDSGYMHSIFLLYNMQKGGHMHYSTLINVPY